MEITSKRVILDTDILIDFLRGRESAIKFIKSFVESGIDVGTTAINIFELSWGAYKIRRLRDV